MGAQIAAHFINAKIPTILFDLAAKEGDSNAVVKGAVERLKKLKPAPLATVNDASYIKAANYDQDLHLLQACDLVIEAIAERMDWKQDLYQKIATHLNPDAIIASNTSGLSIHALSESLPAALRRHFCGVHFFNPPRYMRLVELVPTPETDATILDQLETFLTTTLGKGVIRGKDTANFIANRMGVFSMLAIMHHAEKMALGPELVDALTGPVIGRAKSATFRTADVVGLDTMAHVVKTMVDQLTGDPWHAYFALPVWVNDLIQQGQLGQKSGAGVFKKVGQEIHVYDAATKHYRVPSQLVDASVSAILKEKNPAKTLLALQKNNHPQAQFLWQIFRDLFHYGAYHLASIADTVRDIDLALRWGFAWRQGPFETWQAAGWREVLELVQQDIAAGKAMVKAPLPAWVERDAVYANNQAFSPTSNSTKPRSTLAVYQRQLFPDPVLAETFNEGETLFSNDGMRFWHQGDGVGIISFTSKANSISGDVLTGIQQSLIMAEKHLRAVVLWQRQGENFSVGADLTRVGAAMQAGHEQDVIAMLENFQKTSLALRYAQVPVVAAVRGYVFGGGCELAMHCDRIVAALESYVGLVEAGVGLLPAGGGTKEFAQRASMKAADDPLRLIREYFRMIATAQASTSAIEAKSLGYLRRSDVVIFHPDELLFVAKQQALALAASSYRPRLAQMIKVAGRPGIATLEMMLVNYREGKFISDYDFEIGLNIAQVICGGDIEAGSLVDEAWLLRLEREHFMALLRQNKTQERIQHTLKTGKPLRN
jgi:3-hydroxyacyl-CoA dehydrogenase